MLDCRLNSNEAKLTGLYVVQVGSWVHDDCPNAPAPGQLPASQFDLVLEGRAGVNIGSSGAPYSLVITASDETAMQAVAAMSLTLPLQAFDPADGWKPTPNYTVFVNTKRFTIDVPESVKGHLFHYAATLISPNCQLASFISSSRFLLL